MWYEVGRQENVLLVAVAALIASAIFLLPLKGSSSRYWRVADLAILAVGAFGLFAASAPTLTLGAQLLRRREQLLRVHFSQE